MKATGKIIAWVCILSTLSAGCSSSMLVKPTAGEEEKAYADNIEMVVTKDRTTYEFDEPATVISNAVVGMVDGNEVSVPESDVVKVYVKKFNVGLTLLAAGGLFILAAFVHVRLDPTHGL